MILIRCLGNPEAAYSLRKRMFAQGEIINDTFQVIREIGRGGTGIIYLAFHRHLQKYVVLKRLQTGMANSMNIRNEVDILKNIHHPNLPQVYDFIIQGNEIFTVMDYVDGRDLSKVYCGPRNIPEKMMVSWLRQMAEVLVALEKNDPPIVHSDIKPANIILRPDGSLCLIDFNISVSSDKSNEPMGYSKDFASPEQLQMAEMMINRKPISYTLDVRSDIYSLGATFYYFMTGMQPRGESGKPVPSLKKIRNVGYSMGLCSIIDKCTMWNRRNRYQSAEKLLKAIDHLNRQDSGYRYYVALRSASWILSAALVAGGVFCLLHGGQKQNDENYLSAIHKAERYYDDGDMDQAADTIRDILNNSDYNSVMNKNPQEKIELLHTLGDICYANEEYEEAQENFGEAVALSSEDDQNFIEYKRDYAMALLDSGLIDSAEDELEDMVTLDADPAIVCQVKLAVAAKVGNVELCTEYLDQFLASSASDTEKAGACTRVAAMQQEMGDYVQALNWLSKAEEYSNSKEVWQRAGAIYMTLAGQATDYTSQKSYAFQASKYYDKLTAAPFCSRNDKINAAICDYILGYYEDSIKLLKSCYDEKSDDYQVCMYLAFNYDNYSDRSQVKKYCDEAYDLYQSLSDVEQSNADQNAISKLEEIRDNL